MAGEIERNEKGGLVGPPFFGAKYPRHCEKRSFEATHSFFARRDGLLRFARNDGGIAHSRDPLARNDGIAYLTGRTGADSCSVRSRSVMSTTVTMGAVSS